MRHGERQRLRRETEWEERGMNKKILFPFTRQIQDQMLACFFTLMLKFLNIYHLPYPMRMLYKKCE